MRSSLAFVLAAAASTVLAQECSPLHLIYARATTEPPQNADSSVEAFNAAAAKGWSKGYGAAGYSLYSNVSTLIKGATGWPVHYPASMGESAPKGVQDMIREITEKSKACPNQKYALGGHSQGGMVTVSAIPKIPAEILSRVVAVTMFGSPPCPAAVQGRCNSYCNKGDFVCDGAGGGKGGKGKGGAPGGGKGAGGKGMPKGPKAGGATGVAERSVSADDECAVEEKHTAKTPGNAHLAYNADGYYVKAAACYINAAYRKAGGK